MKTIKIKEFLEKVRKRLDAEGNTNALIFFDVFLRDDLVGNIQEGRGVSANWQELDLDAGDFDKIYPFAVNMLHEAASRNFSEHSDTYKEAHTISTAFCQELNEFFEFSGDEAFDLIPIKSYVDSMVEAGVIKVEGGMVSLTSQGEEMAQGVEREIKGQEN